VSVTPIAFGSITVRDGEADQTTGTVTVSCSGGSASAPLMACLNLGAGSGGAGSGNSPRYMRRNDNLPLEYSLRRGGYGGTTWNNESFSRQLDVNGAATFTETIFAEVTSSGVSVNGGTYSSLFSGADAAFSYGETSCLATGASPTFDVSATVTPSCSIAVSPMAFGSISSLANAVDQTAALDVTCTNMTSYSIKLGLGLGAGVTDPAGRKMTLNAHTITYGLYQNAARTAPWGNAASDDLDSTGTGSTQSYIVYGRILGSQPTPPSGTYTDTIVVLVEY
jgi:spore coat protein U-like protein